VNRQIGVKDFKNVDYFLPLVRGHVTRRMRSDCFRQRKCDQIFSPRNSVTDNRRIIKIGMWVGHEKRYTRNTLKVKRSKVKIKMVMGRSSTKTSNISSKRHSVVEMHLYYRKSMSLERMAGSDF